MKRIYFAIAAWMIVASTLAQKEQNTSIQYLDAEKNWFKITETAGSDVDRIMEMLTSEHLFSNDEDKLVLLQLKEDQLRSQHYRYQQFHSGVKVEGSQFILHVGNDGKIVANGKLVKEITAPSQFQLSEEIALNKALEYIGASEYYWDNAYMEGLIKRIKNDESASFYPTGELVYAEKEYSQDGSKYTLNWKFDIYAKGDKKREHVFVNAMNGSISFTLSGIHETESEGTAVTRYHGEQQIITDSTGSSDQDFILHDSSRGGGVTTYNMQEETDYELAVDFTDEDNYWDNANVAMDEAAGDTHWSMEMTYDYFLSLHGRDSYDDLGSEMISFIHYDEGYFNAFWNGLFMTYGDGNSNPLTSIDVVGHEFTHGVTGNSAGLIYYSESGALNESFSDIFGTAIEFFAIPDSADWLLGLENFNFRNLADPNSFGDPDTYLGDNWVYGEQDNQGVHTNSSVMNKWFYLLSEGGIGETDFGDAYDVEGITIIKASTIAYRNLSVYLTQSSTYADARIGAIQSAEDLFGSCSNEVLQTIKAWHAVGLGVDDFSEDMSLIASALPESSCYLSDSESMDVTMIYYPSGCSDVILAGDSIPFGYRINDGDPIEVYIVLTEDLEGGDMITYTFDGNLDLSEDGKYDFDFWVSLEDDLIAFNDTLFNQTVTHQVVMQDNDVIGFEDYSITLDSIHVERGIHAEAKLSTTADNTGSKGFKMSAYQTILEEINWPDNESQNFTMNPEYESKVCVCVDASDWATARLAFDMKQLHSAYWLEYFGEDRPDIVSSMRILIDGSVIGSQYHPNTYKDDPYITHYVNLDEYAGTVFEACFQSKNFLRNSEDPAPFNMSRGDNTYLDNVRFSESSTLSIEEIADINLNIYPNPSSGIVTLTIVDGIDDADIVVVDALGRVIFTKSIPNSTTGDFEIDLSDFNTGIYVIRIQSNNQTISKRLILN